MTASPPTTPPTIAPIFVLAPLPLLAASGVFVGEEEAFGDAGAGESVEGGKVLLTIRSISLRARFVQ